MLNIAAILPHGGAPVLSGPRKFQATLWQGTVVTPGRVDPFAAAIDDRRRVARFASGSILVRRHVSRIWPYVRRYNDGP